MRIIYNRILPTRGFSAMAFFGVILARRECNPLPNNTINHEAIHAAQAAECGGWVLFYLKYAILWLVYGYDDHPFEREAYRHEDDRNYLKYRRAFEWKRL